MAALLATASALLFGAADFAGGYATKRVNAITAVVASQPVGLMLLTAALPVLPPASYTPADLAWGAAGGAAGGVGLLLLYHGLAFGRIAVVAPSSAVVAAAVPIAIGVLLGERPGAMSWGGVALAIPAIVILSIPGNDEGAKASKLLHGLLAGLAFGVFFVFLAQAGSDSGLVPLVAARIGSIVPLAAIGLAGKALVVPRGNVWLLLVVAGAFDMAANILFLLAVREGLLVLVAVLVALYPAGTVLLGRLLLDEPITSRSLAGLALAIAAVALIGTG